MKTILILFAAFFISHICAAQAPAIRTDTTRGFSSAGSAVLSMVFVSKGTVAVTFSNGSYVNLVEVLALDMKGFSPTHDQILLTCIAYMKQHGFRPVSSFTVGEYHTRHVFVRE